MGTPAAMARRKGINMTHFTPIEAPRDETRAHSSTHRNVVIGVTLLTVVTLFGAFFWAGMYITDGREWPSLGIGLFGTAISWIIDDQIID
jgi:hypothetical protein